MPNCTCYAYGRAWEILGSEPALSHGNAGKWYWENKSSNNYAYGSTPKLGAIACWDKNDKNQGHVAVVEAINGSRVTLSESHYSGVFFDNKEMNADGSDYLKSFRFLGYIYIGEFDSDTSPEELDNSYSVPMTVTAGHKIATYDGNGNQESGHWIDAGDVCTIEAFYLNGYVKITYPTSNGPRTAYARKEDFDLTPQRHDPIGYLEVVSGGFGTVYIKGWALDEDTPDKAVELHVYVDGPAGIGNCIAVGIMADKPRSDVNEVTGIGGDHGFEFTLDTIALGIDGVREFYVHPIDTDHIGGNPPVTVIQNKTRISNPVNLGDNFNAEIICNANGKYVFASLYNNNVELGSRNLNGLIAPKRIWNFARQSDNSYRITNYYNSNVLDAVAIDSDGSNVGAYEWHGRENQRWFLISNGDGYYLQPAFSKERALDVSGEEMSDHSNMQIWLMNDSEHQRFSINNVSGDTEAPVIKSVEFSDITPSGYKVTIQATDNVGVKKIAVPVWTDKDGQDDLFKDWKNTTLATQINETTWQYLVNTADHNNECGVYNTDIYVYDFNNNESAHHGENNLRHFVNVGMYDLTLDPNGGVISVEGNEETSSPVTCVKNKLIYNTSNFYSLTWAKPKRDGFIFKGWYTEKTGGVQTHDENGKCVNEGTYFKDNNYCHDDNLTVYAHFEKIPTTTMATTTTILVSGGSTTTTTTTTTVKPLLGDANCDGEVNIADATAIIQAIGNKDKYALTEQGEINADCYNTGDGVTGMDSIVIQQIEAGIYKLSDLPIKD